jgi:Ca2+-binding EF-hand superfamily protein
MRILTLAAVAAFAVAGMAHAQAITTDDLAALDTDGDGAVSQTEFDVFLDQAFAKLDANGDGYVTVEESSTVMTPEQFTAANANGDGGLSLSEFKVAAQKDFVAADTDGNGALD